MGGPPSSGSPIPFQTRPSQPSPTGISSGWPSNATETEAGSMPEVALQDLYHRHVAVDFQN